MISPVKQDLNSERGAVLVLGIIVLGLALVMATLVIDVQLGERTGRMIQRTVDSAALAGTTQLIPQDKLNIDDQVPAVSLQGWRKAKRAAVALLRAGRFYGDSGMLQGAMMPAEGTAVNPWETAIDSNYSPEQNSYKFVSYAFGNPVRLEITIERGVFYKIPPMTAPIFVALENGSTCGQFVFPGSIPGGFCQTLNVLPPKASAPTHLFANATRVVANLKHLPTVFARIQHVAIGEFGDITRMSVAAQDIQ